MDGAAILASDIDEAAALRRFARSSATVANPADIGYEP
jgi:hypothetical protein